jgi:hypothetical protein
VGQYEGSSGYSLGGNSPILNGGYLDGSDVSTKHLKSMMDWRYTSAYPCNAAYWQQGAIDKRFKVGDQSLWSMIYGDNQWYQSRRFFFNMIRRHINMICGYQRKNRKSTITMPTQDDTDPLVDDYNKVLKWGEERDGFQEYFSQAFEGACDTGSSLLHLYPDYTLDPISGDLFTDQVAYNNFLIDPYYRKQDLTDCSFIWRRRWVNKTAAKALLPGYAKEIDKMNPSGMKDGRFPLQAELINLDTNRLFTYDEFHYRDTREATVILDPKSGEAVEWEEMEDEHEDMLKMVLRQQPWLITKKTQVPTVKLCIALGGVPVYNGENLLRIDSYPMIPTLCYHEPDIQSYAWRVQGIVRNLRDAQYLYNMRKVIELDILQSQINSGWIYPVDAVTDPKAFRQSGQGFLVPLKAGHLPQELQRIEPPAIPASMLELSKSLSEDITKISGVNEELLGSATDDKAGILAALRQGAGLVTLQTIFDKLDYSQRLYGKIRLQAIRKNFSKGKIASILGHQADDRFFTSHSLKYSIAVEEGNYSTTQRQMELQQLLHFKEIGVPISNSDILRAAFITNKKQVIENMERESQAQQQMQQQQAEQQSKIDESKIIETFTRSRLNAAKEKEALSKVDENEGKAEHEKISADLNLVKMMIELESLDMDTFAKSFEMAQAIKAANSDKIVDGNA